ncbi:hypothetical protein [Nocardioides mesophilus]|uniref:Uncharacterized protein n=1 Tax=Nocardioides mesophilus TaxID=433659 RepID=A0A7G9R7J9_9ACTN|nr:hypothetical protein [Nocardioides mesophilus]QNN51574.1 hypothetical protein H9L09_13435 [Nocardioides mesophilus]
MTTDTLAPEAPAPPPAKAGRRIRRRLVVLAAVLSLVAVGCGIQAWRVHRASDVRNGTTLVTADGMAARYGIDIDLLAITAAGGLVELRYQVVDPDKAAPLVHDPDLSPALVSEETGRTLVMSTPPHHHGTELQLGGTYFFLMANAETALHKGDEVTLIIGDARLEHLEMQG